MALFNQGSGRPGTVWQRMVDALFGYDFFISYAHADGKTYADALAFRLRQEHNFNCFLDTEDYVKGDDWEAQGAWALKRTSRLILVGTAKAVESKPVLRELRIFTGAGKRVVPIDFDGSLDRLEGSNHPVAELIRSPILRIRESGERLQEGPTDASILDLARTFDQTRQSTKRQRWLQGGFLVLLIFLALAVWQAMRAEAQKRIASRQLAEARWLIAHNAREDSPVEATHYLWHAAAAAQAAGDSAGAEDASLAARLAGNGLTATLVHDGPVSQAMFSPDGRRILTVSGDRTARLWNATDGRSMSPPLRHKELLLGGGFSLGGDTAMTWTAEGTANLWNGTNGQWIGEAKLTNWIYEARLLGDGSRIFTWTTDAAQIWSTNGSQLSPPMHTLTNLMAADVSVDGARVVACGKDGEVRIWEATDRFALGVLLIRTNGLFHVHLSRDGVWLLACNGQTALVWSLTNGPVLRFALGHSNRLGGASFSRDGQRVLTWTIEGMVRVWEMTNGAPAGWSMNHGPGLEGAEFTSDGRHVFTWGMNGQARLWLNASPRSFRQRIKHEQRTEIAHVSGDGRRILSGSSDGTVRLSVWAEEAATVPAILPDHRIYGTRLSPDGKRFLSWGEWPRPGTVWLGDARDRRPINPAPMSHPQFILGGVFSDSGRYAATWSLDGTARLWSATNGAAMRAPMVHRAMVNGARFSADERTLLTWSADGTARLWPVRAGETQEISMVHAKDVLAARFSPDEASILTLCADGTAQLWKRQTGEAIGGRMSHGSDVREAQFNQDGDRVFTWSINGALAGWSASSGRMLGESTSLGAGIRSAKFGHTGKRILVYRDDGTAFLCATPDGRLLGQPLMHEGAVEGVVFSPDDRQLLTWGVNGNLWHWDGASGLLRGRPMKHARSIAGACFNEDQRRILTWCSDGTVRLWSTDYHQCVAVYPSMEVGVTVAFDPGGSRLVGATGLMLDAAVNPPVSIPERLLEFEVRSGTALTNGQVRVLTSSEWEKRFQKWLRMGNQSAVAAGSRRSDDIGSRLSGSIH